MGNAKTSCGPILLYESGVWTQNESRYSCILRGSGLCFVPFAGIPRGRLRYEESSRPDLHLRRLEPFKVSRTGRVARTTCCPGGGAKRRHKKQPGVISCFRPAEILGGFLCLDRGSVDAPRQQVVGATHFVCRITSNALVRLVQLNLTSMRVPEIKWRNAKPRSAKFSG